MPTKPIEDFVDQEAVDQRRLDQYAEIRTEVVASEDPYLALPLAIRFNYTREEYLWLSDEQKGNLIQSECDPEC